MSYQVVAPLVLAKDREGKVHERYEGAIIQWLPKDQAEHLLSIGFVVELGGDADNEDEAAGADDDAADAEDAADDDEPDKPKQAAPKAAWEEYAVERAPEGQRISQEEAESLTKKELIERFG